uniref:DUF4220 domain-containing protein n=1 Tax=Quercus lobata TaxID=97700 RepID=A0A7N2LMG8_QUELO
MLTPDTGPNYSKFMREYTLTQFEGFHVLADEVIEAQVVNLSSVENDSIRDATELVTAYDLIYIFKCLFVDLILGFDDRDNSRSLFKEISWNKAFKVIEMELGFIRAAVLEKYRGLQVEFDQSILIWHIDTDLCYYSDWRDQDAIMPNGKLSKWQSQYALYLLVMCPFMLPMGLGMIRFRDTCADVTIF